MISIRGASLSIIFPICSARLSMIPIGTNSSSISPKVKRYFFSMYRSIMVMRLQPFVHLPYHFVLPWSESSLRYPPARLSHQPKIESQVVQSGDAVARVLQMRRWDGLVIDVAMSGRPSFELTEMAKTTLERTSLLAS